MKRKIYYLLVACFLLIVTSCHKTPESITFAFYNVENLFDTIDAPDKPDEEFLPGSEKKWNTQRYNKKLADLAKVISSINSDEMPAVLGLCEVENRLVVDDLVATSPLLNNKYKIVHYESPDYRGIDNALIYNSSILKVIKSEAIPVVFEGEQYTTRDILYVKAQIKKDVFHFYVNHWPSRRGGEKESAFRRNHAAKILKTHIDQVVGEEPLAKIVVMGDMNDEPSNESLYKYMDARYNGTGSLYNLMYDNMRNGEGSYNYRGDWNMIDNILVSRSMFNGEGYTTSPDNGFVFRKPFIEFKNQNGEVYPSRTYGGSNYYGGFSDHFPVYFTLSKN